MLVPQPGIRTRPWKQKHQALTTGVPGNSLKFLILMEPNLSIFFVLYGSYLWCQAKNTLPSPSTKDFFLCFFSQGFIILHFTFKSLCILSYFLY